MGKGRASNVLRMRAKKAPHRHPVPEFTENELLKIIRDAADADDGRLTFSKHARERMQEKDISDMEVEHLLRSTLNRAAEEPLEEVSGDWRLTVRGAAAGISLHVVVAIKMPAGEAPVIVVTTFNK